MKVLLKGQLKFMQDSGLSVTMISSDGAEVEGLKRQEDCPHIAIPFTRTISPFKDFICLVKLTKLFRKLRPQIVHTHTPKAGLLGMWAAWLAKVPVRLHTVAGLPWMESGGLLRKLLLQVEKLTAMHACCIYPNSFVLKNFLEKHNIGAGKLKVLGKGSSNGVDSAYFSVTEKISAEAANLRGAENINKNAWIWIFVGRLVKDKGIAELLEAFETVHKSFPADRLWLVGNEEPKLDPLDARHKKMLHTHPAVRCWGFQHDIRPFLAASQVLTFPSYREGFPNVPMQAGAMGCMLLLSDINGCNEIVTDKQNGLLIPPKNSEALSIAMLFIRRNPAIRDNYAAAIKSKIQTDYNQQKLWQLIIEEYRSLLMKKAIAFPAHA